MHKQIRLILALFISMPTASLAATPVFEPGDCPFEVPKHATGLQCGYLEVAENRANPERRKLRLAVAILESFSENPKPDPLVFLSGGPGGASLKFVPWRMDSAFWNRIRQDRDVVFYDQRGTGFSDPAFCPEMDVALATLGFRGLDSEEQQRQELAAVEICREKMLADGIDFAHYNSTTSAHDLADLRLALGIEEWNLFGVSYGTRLALIALREAPDGIRSVIIDSVYPPNYAEANGHELFARSLRLVFDGCLEDIACQTAFPRLEQNFYAMLQNLETDPIEITMADTSRFPDGRIVVDGSLMAAGVFLGLYDGKFAEVFPLLVREVGARNADVLRTLADGLVADPHNLRMGQNYAIQCFEGIGRASPAAVAADRATHPELEVWSDGRNELALCDAWHSERAGSEFAKPVYSEVPTLLFAGELDPITPPAAARLAKETLSNSTLIVVPGAGHTASPTSECTQDLFARFLTNPGKALDTECLVELPEQRFITQVRMTPGLSQMMAQAGGGALPATVLAAGAAAIILASVLVAWPLTWLWRRLRGRAATHPVAARRARWLAVLAALLLLGFLGATATAILATMSDNPFLLVFGLPTSYTAIFVLPWLAFLAALATVASAIAAWRSSWWGAAARVHYSLVALAGLGLAAWVASLGFI